MSQNFKILTFFTHQERQDNSETDLAWVLTGTVLHFVTSARNRTTQIVGLRNLKLNSKNQSTVHAAQEVQADMRNCKSGKLTEGEL